MFFRLATAFCIFSFSASIAESAIPLNELPGFPPQVTNRMAKFGVTTDRAFFIAGAVNPEGVSEAGKLSIPETKILVASVWRTLNNWPQDWGKKCQLLLVSGDLSPTFERTPLLALSGMPLEVIPPLAAAGIATAEAFYAADLLNRDRVRGFLAVDEGTYQGYLDGIHSGAPHVVAVLERMRRRNPFDPTTIADLLK